MDDERDIEKLRAMLAAANAEKADAMVALQVQQRQGHDQTRLLMEEQDRFVSRLLAAHERDIGKLRLEFEEAKTTCERLHQKLRRDREGAEKLEEELAKARFEMDRLREQRNTLRTEAQLARDGRATMQARIDQLEANLALAKAMLDDAMGDSGSDTSGFVPAHNPLSAHRRLRPDSPRESGIARAGRLRPSPSPYGLTPITEIDVPVDTPRTATAASRSRPPR
jgi:hypothetical protein